MPLLQQPEVHKTAGTLPANREPTSAVVSADAETDAVALMTDDEFFAWLETQPEALGWGV
jgi:hypothetical protein